MIILFLILFFELCLIKTNNNKNSLSTNFETHFIICLKVKREIPDDEIEKYSSTIKDKIESLGIGKIEFITENKRSNFFEKFFKKTAFIYEALISGFPSVIGGYAANKLISKIEKNPVPEQAQA